MFKKLLFLASISCIALPVTASELYDVNTISSKVSSVSDLPTGTTFPLSLVDPSVIAMVQAGSDLLPSDFDTEALSPPEWSTLEARNEFQDYQGYQRFRVPDHLEAGMLENGRCSIDLFNLYGLIPHPDDAPALWELLSNIGAEVSFFAARDALKFMRARPGQVYKDIDTLVSTPALPSYPSTWGSEAYAVAFTLTYLDPDRLDLYFGLADDITARRVIMGANLPLDMRSAKLLAGRVTVALFEHADITPLLGDARQELLQYHR